MKTGRQTLGTFTAVATSTLLAFTSITQNAGAQATCGNLLASGPTISPISGSRVVVGQMVTITTYKVASVANNCLFLNGDAWMAYPDGTVVQTLDNFSLNPGQVKDCLGTVGNADTACLGFTTTYTVSAADVNRTLSIVMPPRGQFDGSTETYTGQANQIHWLGAANVDGFDPTPPGVPTGAATGSGRQLLVVMRPCITITKECVNPCTPYGQPIQFRGTVCNTGNTKLGSIVVTDNPAAPIVFAATNSGGRPFDPNAPDALLPGECVNYTGSYSPAGSGVALCGPFTDTISVSAHATQDAAGNPIIDSPLVKNTDPCYDANFVSSGPRPPVTATCNVCTTPAIAITKACPPGLIQPGSIVNVSGTVTNTGNVPLTNVVVTNFVASLNATRRVLGPITLAAGAGTTWSDSYTAPADSCPPYTDTAAASGTDLCTAQVVTANITVNCPGTNNPSIAITKACPAGLIQPGDIVNVTGTVTNTGNITLTNVNVTNVISAINATRRVLGPLILAPNEGATWTDSYVAPLDSCPPYTDTATASGADKCFGRIVTNSALVDCPGTNGPSIDVTKSCPAGLIQPGGTVVVTGSVTNTGNITLTNVNVTNVISAISATRRVLGPLTLAPGAGATWTDTYVAPLDSCPPYTDTATASGADKCFGRIVTDSALVNCPGTNSPSIDVTKNCPAGLIQPGGTVLVTGTVANTGNITLTNVVVTNHIAALGISRRVFGPVNLAPGVGANFSDSYLVPLDSCGPYADTFAASGADKCFGRIVIDNATVACPSTNNPGIGVFKRCPPNPVPPGGLMVVTGYVTNTGNITLTNVSVTNVIVAIGQTRRIFGPVSLPPGGSAAFSDSYVVPPDSCGPYRDTFLASGADKCFGRIVTASDFKDCPGITTPRIAVIKQCPVIPVAPGGIAVFSGTVSNAGNITLTNVYVVNNRPTNNTPVIGPITLAPGQATNFTGSYAIPANCCSYFDTLIATGNSYCTGSNVLASATAVCPTATDPRLEVTKRCPPNPVPLGQSLVFSGSVSNAGNITLTGVTVVDNLPTNNTPVLGPITLAPGESAEYLGSYVVPINICSPTITDTVTARGTNICTGSNVTASATAVCPIIPTPRLSLTKVCPPNPVAPGELLVYSGIVSNSGSLTITNVFVVNDRPAPETPVIGPITLAPGQSTNFTGSYIAPYDCCGPCVDTLTARGQEFCKGSNVVATASAACPRSSTPGIRVTRDCPPGPPTLGDLVFVTGIVSNSGNATLVNVRLLDDQAGVILDSAALAPGEAVWYLGMYITTNCGPSLPAGITATANDACFSTTVSNRFVTTCGVLCPSNLPVVLLNPHIANGEFLFSFQTEANHDYKIQFTPTLGPESWQDLATLPGTGAVLTVSHSAADTQGYYRVVRQ